MTLGVGDSRIGALPRDWQGVAVQTRRGWANDGLLARVLGRWTYTVTAGTEGSPNTHDLTVGGVSILGGPVVQGASNNATATAIATAVNANTATTGFFATVSSATVTIRQGISGAVTMTKVVAGDAAGTLTAAAASTDTWSEVVSGATFDGDEYYQLSWSGSTVVSTAIGVNLARAVPLFTKLKVTGQDFQLWSGRGIRAPSNTILPGSTVDADTWSERLPWCECALPLFIKLAADAPLLYEVDFV